MPKSSEMQLWDAGFSTALMELDNIIRITFPDRSTEITKVRSLIIGMLNDITSIRPEFEAGNCD